MPNHDRYDNDILKQLTRIANSLEKVDSLPYSGLITSKKDLVEVTRCKNCIYYISADDMKNDEMYKGYENILGCDGICTSTDKWTYETDFCSSGKEE